MSEYERGAEAMRERIIACYEALMRNNDEGIYAADVVREFRGVKACRGGPMYGDTCTWCGDSYKSHIPTPPAPDADPKPAAVSAKPARQLLTDKPDAVAARERFTEAALEFEEVARMGTQVGYVEARVAKDRAYDALLATEQGEREGGGE